MTAKKKKKSNKLKLIIIPIIVMMILVFIFKNRLKPFVGSLQSYASEYFHDYDNSNFTFGIDISHYQQNINWKEVKKSKHPIRFVFIRATMGAARKDKKFARNWKESKKNKFIRGAYHYYDPNENSTLQAENFINRVKLKKSDFPPVLDIEELSKFGNFNLHKGLKNWLSLVEKHYKRKPIIYTGYKYYINNLQNEFSDYPLWVAAYSRSKKSVSKVDWQFHQFTDKVSVQGIEGYTDGNDFNGSIDELKEFVKSK